MKPKGWIAAAVAVTLLLAGLSGVHFFRKALQDIEPLDAGLSVWGDAPLFALEESGGGTVKSEDLKGRVWLADFIFTHCTGPCPVLTSQMQALQEMLDPEWPVTLISFTVDPDRDTPEVLAKYATRYGADPDRWCFLTGDRDVIYDLVGTGFNVPVGPPQPGSDQMIHSLMLVLVDGEGQIRNIYNVLAKGVAEKILPDVERLVVEGRQE